MSHKFTMYFLKNYRRLGFYWNKQEKKNQERKRYRIKETKNPTKTVKDGSQCKSQGANYTKQTGESNPEKASTEVSSCKKQESDWWLIHLKYGKLYLDGMEGYKNT